MSTHAKLANPWKAVSYLFHWGINRGHIACLLSKKLYSVFSMQSLHIGGMARAGSGGGSLTDVIELRTSAPRSSRKDTSFVACSCRVASLRILLFSRNTSWWQPSLRSCCSMYVSSLSRIRAFTVRANIRSNSWRAILSCSGGSLRGREATGGPLVGMWWVTVCFTGWSGGGGRSKHGNSVRMAVKLSEGFGSGTDGLGEGSWVRMPWTCSWERVSTRQRCLTSTNRLKCPRKSAPRIGCFTSATMKVHWKGRRSPRFRQRGRTPWVAIGDWLAACREGPVEG